MDETSARESMGTETLVAAVTDEFMERLRRGEQPDVEEYIGRHPRIAPILRHVLPALQVMGSATPGLPAGPYVSPTDFPPEARLGDFRIIRELGRGGMGIVYQAVQVSLGRDVALKVLPFAAALDPKHLQRFQNEAQAAAHLHHTNIVPVYGVGCERGVHYYAMQYIEGQTLAAVIAELRRLSRREAETRDEPAGPATVTARDLASGRWALARRGPDGAPGSSGVGSADPAPTGTGAAPPVKVDARRPAATPSTETSTRKPAYFRTVANLGVQAALALERAHSLGVIHRDIKPANLIVDIWGNLWVTDFGLARLQGGAELTVTGDLVGTLRYMSPEQALARSGGVDHRTDIYSLGITLYELITLEPAFGGRDRGELLRQIAFDEPRRPRLRNPDVPSELETIVLKAIEKDPGQRYATAAELGADLQRFLDVEPIRARRPSLLDRAAKWSRRHRPVMITGAAGLVMALAVLAGSVGWNVRDRSARRAEVQREVLGALEQAQAMQSRGQWAEAWAAAQRAQGLLAGHSADAGLLRRVRALEADLEEDRRMLARLQEAEMMGTQINVAEHRFGNERAIPELEAAFREYGVDCRSMPAVQAVQRIRRRPPAVQFTLIAALDRWETTLGTGLPENPPQQAWLAAVLQALDSDPWRARIREAVRRKNFGALAELARSPGLTEQAPLTLRRLGWLLCEQAGQRELGLAVLHRAQQKYPDDFWINSSLGYELKRTTPPRREEAVRYDSIAVALQPENAGALLNLGNSLRGQGQLEEAITCYRKAVERKPDYADAYNGLGVALSEQGKLDEAIAAFRRASELIPGYAMYSNNLASALFRQGRLEEALVVDRALIERKLDNVNTHNHLGLILEQQDKVEEAIAEFRKALAMKADFAEAHYNLGRALYNRGAFAEALDHLKRGHELGSRDPRWSLRLPSAQWVEACARLVELEARLPRVLAGEQAVANTEERLSFAHLCYLKQMFERATRFYEEALGQEPGLADDRAHVARYNAACCAALAALGAGEDASSPGDDRRARRRRQARDWLRDDLRQQARDLEKADPPARLATARTLQHWLHDPDLRGLRDSEHLAELPAEERDACARLWSDVHAVLDRARREGGGGSRSPP
jgi:serine/threonine protein kinase/Flp pilus assembly protein TadD